MLKRLVSYFLPVTIYQKKSAVSKNIEVTWNNGQLVIDSKNTNYSYGSLQRVLRKGLKKVGFKSIQSMEHILILGVAGGSVIKTLIDEINYKGKITGVEIDSEINQIANDYFGLNHIPNVEIIIDDAFEFVLKTKKQYDLIIIDIFQDTVMPNFLFEKFFINRIGNILKTEGFILFNTMILNATHKERNDNYRMAYDNHMFRIEKLPRIEEHNELMIIQKIA